MEHWFLRQRTPLSDTRFCSGTCLHRFFQTPADEEAVHRVRGEVADNHADLRSGHDSLRLRLRSSLRQQGVARLVPGSRQLYCGEGLGSLLRNLSRAATR